MLQETSLHLYSSSSVGFPKNSLKQAPCLLQGERYMKELAQWEEKEIQTFQFPKYLSTVLL